MHQKISPQGEKPQKHHNNSKNKQTNKQTEPQNQKQLTSLFVQI